MNSYWIDSTKELYPESEVLYRWCTEDCISLDKIPYIGNFSNIMSNLYVATGFKKWGITFSYVASKIIELDENEETIIDGEKIGAGNILL